MTSYNPRGFESMPAYERSRHAQEAHRRRMELEDGWPAHHRDPEKAWRQRFGLRRFDDTDVTERPYLPRHGGFG